MNIKRYFTLTAVVAMICFISTIQAQTNDLKILLNTYFSAYTNPEVELTGIVVDSIAFDSIDNRLNIYVNPRLAYQPFREETVERINADIKNLLSGKVADNIKPCVFSGEKAIESLIPNFFLSKDKKDNTRIAVTSQSKNNPWTQNISRPFFAERGLEGHHLALWQSHGRYYAQKRRRWEWQRPKLYCTAEDLFTQSIVLPFLIPMLENAGAVVFTPRERDTQRNEVLVDNDGNLAGSNLHSEYAEINDNGNKWSSTGKPGFAHKQRTYKEGNNPFKAGSARLIKSHKNGKASAQWVPDIPKRGEYAVYVSYQTLPNSISDAHYTVYHSGGATSFKVNQRMGGGTWVYLGTFSFWKGINEDCKVILTNDSDEEGVVTADCVRFGGGMGNIVRGGQASGLPRFMEGARYYAQWAGMNDTIYSTYKGRDDYSDDINARSKMVDFLAGGSAFNPEERGGAVPFETLFSVHSDAGINNGDSIVGTLAVYTTDYNDGKLADGTSRMASRDLADIIQTQIVDDMRNEYGVYWRRRAMWDRNYSETRLPAMPSAIIETLSHQNFQDMRLGHDPNFKFSLARSIYKGIIKYTGEQHGTNLTVQPLPISHFAAMFTDENAKAVKLTWKETEDKGEPSAKPEAYILYMRAGDGGFDNGTLIRDTCCLVTMEPGTVYSFRVTAVNSGGQSMPSETLSAYFSPKEQGRVLIINGFNRLSGPAMVNSNGRQGFDIDEDSGVSYMKDISLVGRQKVFDVAARENLRGDTGNELESMTIAGNTFDYPYIHGKAIAEAGNYSFTSCSSEAIEDNTVTPWGYRVIDLILGLEKSCSNTYPFNGTSYKTFSKKMQNVLRSFCLSNGRILVSGAYIGRDMNDDDADRRFTKEVLKYSFGATDKQESTDKHIEGMSMDVVIPCMLNDKAYAVTSSDIIVPDKNAFTTMVYSSSRQSAAVAYDGNDYKSIAMGFPFESIDNSEDRHKIMGAVLRFLFGN